MGKLNRLQRYEGFESGFRVRQSMREKAYEITTILNGDALDFSNSFVLEKNKEDYLDMCPNGQDSYFLIDVHTHPENNRVPSVYEEDQKGDLFNIAYTRIKIAQLKHIDARPIEVILEQSTGNMLLIQESTRAPLGPATLGEVAEQLKDFYPDEKPEVITAVLRIQDIIMQNR